MLQNDASAAQQVAGVEREALKKIVGKYNMSEEDIKSKCLAHPCYLGDKDSV